MLQDNEMALTEFGEFLLRKHLVPEHTARYYVAWTRRFLRMTPDPTLSLDDRKTGVRIQETEGKRQETEFRSQNSEGRRKNRL